MKLWPEPTWYIINIENEKVHHIETPPIRYIGKDDVPDTAVVKFIGHKTIITGIKRHKRWYQRLLTKLLDIDVNFKEEFMPGERRLAHEFIDNCEFLKS